MRFARVFLSHWKSGRVISSVYCHSNMSSAYNSTGKKRKGLQCYLLALMRKMLDEMLDNSSNSYFLFSGIEEPDWGPISPELSPERVWGMFNCCLCETVVYLAILWTFFVSWQLHINISWRHVVVDYSLNPPQFFCRWCFLVPFIKLLSWFTPTGAFLNQGCRSEILHCLLPKETVHRRFLSPRLAFLHRLCKTSLDIPRYSAQLTFSV